MPFGFHGAFTVSEVARSLPQAANLLAARLASEGARKVEQVDSKLIFGGDNRRGLSVLQDLDSGTIELIRDGNQACVRFAIKFGYWNFFVSILMMLAGLAMNVLSSHTQGSYVCGFGGLIVLALTISYNYFARGRFVRWLRKAAIFSLSA